MESFYLRGISGLTCVVAADAAGKDTAAAEEDTAAEVDIAAVDCIGQEGPAVAGGLLYTAALLSGQNGR